MKPLRLAVGIALIVNLTAVILINGTKVYAALGFLLLLPAVLFWVWGCAAYAKNKGYSELLGFLGLVGLLGLFVLVFLPDVSR